MSAQGNIPAQNEASAIGSGSSNLVALNNAHPVATYPPGAESPRQADAINAAVLRLRGYQTDATGLDLWGLATKAEDNALYEEPGDEESSFQAILRGNYIDTTAANAGAEGPLGNFLVLTAEGDAIFPARIGRGSGSGSNSNNNYTLVFDKPLHFFFYGSLQDPKQLSMVCRLDYAFEKENDANAEVQPPVLRKASIRGWRLMMWGPFPSLVPGGPDDRVDGVVWACEKGRHVMNLCIYETDNYRLEYCDIHVEDEAATATTTTTSTEKEEKGKDNIGGGAATEGKDEIIRGGRIFVNAGPVRELKEGSFDLEHWKATKYN